MHRIYILKNTKWNKTKPNEISFLEDWNKLRYILCSWIGKLKIVNMSSKPILTYKFNAIQLKKKEKPARFFVNMGKLILKFIWKSKESSIPTIFKITTTKKTKMGVLPSHDFTMYYTAASVVLVKGRYIDQ